LRQTEIASVHLPHPYKAPGLRLWIRLSFTNAQGSSLHQRHRTRTGTNDERCCCLRELQTLAANSVRHCKDENKPQTSQYYVNVLHINEGPSHTIHSVIQSPTSRLIAVMPRPEHVVRRCDFKIVKKVQHKESVRPVISNEAARRVHLQIRNDEWSLLKVTRRVEQNLGVLCRFPSALVKAQIKNNTARVTVRPRCNDEASL
jgi:hypothetical protein